MKLKLGHIVAPPGATINLSSPLFHRWARDCIQCFEGFKPAKFSPVPYSLLCRALEYELKSRLLRHVHVGGPSRKTIKDKYLIRSATEPETIVAAVPAKTS